MGLGRHVTIPENWQTLIQTQSVPGVTKTRGINSDGTLTVPNNSWKSSKKGLANTVGNAPISHAASQQGLANLAGTMTWYNNYGVLPWCYVSYNVPLTNPVSLVVPFNDPGPDTATLPIPSGLQFVPLFLDASHVNTQELAWAKPYVQSSGYCITFNEPYGEGNMTPAQAIAVWPQIQAMVDSVGGKIIAPSIGFGSAAAQTWLSIFMGLIAANGLRVDILNFHETLGSFDDSPGIPGQIQGYIQDLDAMHAAYPAYDIWITESQFVFTAQQRITDFWAGVLPRLEARPWVKRYAWWPLGTDPLKTPTETIDSLSMCDTNGTITTTGTTYNNYTRK